nr:uncharacterized protein LOC111423889 [Onthophagus taurus]XP_022913040.1 uncharacterized protein LOC111423889 [Onthophagus taurus]
MIRYSFFLLVFVILSYAEFENDSVFINIRNNYFCVVETELIQPPFFDCQQNDYSGIQYNSTHSSYTWEDVKCYATIDNIKVLARYCDKIGSVTYNNMDVPAMLGRDRMTGKPLNEQLVFNRKSFN